MSIMGLHSLNRINGIRRATMIKTSSEMLWVRLRNSETPPTIREGLLPSEQLRLKVCIYFSIYIVSQLLLRTSVTTSAA